MSLKNTLIGGLAVAALSAPAFADQTDFSFPVHDIIITSNIPTVHITVRNMSNSTDPADRDLRVVSATPVIPVTGQVWCKSYNHAENDALRAQVMFGAAAIAASQNGADPLMLTFHSPSEVDTFSGTHNLENFAIDAEFNFPDSFDRHALVSLDPFNPVRTVENRMEHYVDNNAGTEADFMRVDDVFETQVSLSSVGWCGYESNNTSGEYAGARSVSVDVAIFYQGDEDIQDVIQTVGGANTVAAQTPNRARRTTSTRDSSATPPARNSRPARALPSRSDNNKQQRPAPRRRQSAQDIDSGNGGSESVSSFARYDGIPGESSNTAPGNDGLDTDSDGASAAALIVPAVQSARAGSGRPQANTGVEPDEIDAPAQANTGVEPDEIDARATAPQTAALDALLIINRAADEPQETSSSEAHLDYLVITMEAMAAETQATRRDSGEAHLDYLTITMDAMTAEPTDLSRTPSDD